MQTLKLSILTLLAASIPAPCMAQGVFVNVIKPVVAEAFLSMHDGWSSDEVLLQDELNRKFIEACRADLPDADPAELNWTLLNLRKAGKLKAETTQRGPSADESTKTLAEIVARSMQDKHKVSIDRIMCDPELRSEFDQLAQKVAPDTDTYLMRKAAFQLRKTRRLKPELITRIADWGREVIEYPAKQLRDQPELVSEHPGIYIFRDASGYLYIGQTDNLRVRLAKHLDESHNESLAKYLTDQGCEDITIEIHDFDPESRAQSTRIRRAYESELIASRRPRFNIQP